MKAVFKKALNLNYTFEQISEIIHSFSFGIILLGIIIPLVVGNILYESIEHIYLFIWLLLQLFVLGVRVYIGHRLKNYLENKNTKKIMTFFKYYLCTIFLSGALWGFIFVLAILNSSQTITFFLITVVFALSSGSVLTLGNVFISVCLYNIPLILPPLIAFILTIDNELYFLEGLLLFAFILVTLKILNKRQKTADHYEQNIALMKQYESITNLSTIVSKTDKKGIITFANDNFCKISGYTETELIGKNHNIVRHPDMPTIAYKNMWKTISKEKKSWHGIIKNRAKNGDTYYVSSTVSPILDAHNNITEYIALRHDVSSIMSDKKQLFDYLNANKLSVLIMIKIEDYSTLERFYDSSTVEKIEKTFGDVILHLLPNDCNFQRVYHLENGLYALAKDRRTCQKTQSEIEAVLKQFLLNVQGYSVKLGKINYDISAICSYTYGVIQIFEDVKIGIEKAIETKKDIVYADGLSGIEYAIALKNIETLHVLKVALDDKKIISYFQPIINNETKKVEKYESLVRLINENDEIVPPIMFLEAAKKGRYYNKVTRIVLENTFIRLGDTDKEISMNLSTLDIESKDIQKLIFTLLEKYKNEAHRVVFELLESEDGKDFNSVIDFIKRVKLYGVQIAIDDFGTGYSNFKRLLQYEPDILKIDGSLIKDIQTNKLSINIVETIVLFAHKQNIKTIAEYVENEDIYNIVKELGIDYSQGYAFGRPEELMKD